MSKSQFFDSEGKEVFDLEIFVPRRSAVDAYVTYAVYDNGVEVPDGELAYLTEEYSEYVQDYAYSNGSRNHN